MLVAYLENVTGRLSSYVMVYVGLTGEGAVKSARRASGLTGRRQERGEYRSRFRTERE